jgi:hypothetical protein
MQCYVEADQEQVNIDPFLSAAKFIRLSARNALFVETLCSLKRLPLWERPTSKQVSHMGEKRKKK